MRISTGTLTHDPVARCWKNEPIELTDDELNAIEAGYRAEVRSDTFTQYLRAIISLAQELKKTK